MNKSRNILDTVLELLKVKHAKSFTSKLFNGHPHKYNLFGLSKMLFGYIQEVAIRFLNKRNNRDDYTTKCRILSDASDIMSWRWGKIIGHGIICKIYCVLPVLNSLLLTSQLVAYVLSDENTKVNFAFGRSINRQLALIGKNNLE